jgi:hypothetical protein
MGQDKACRQGNRYTERHPKGETCGDNEDDARKQRTRSDSD